MATEYGYRDISGNDFWDYGSRDEAKRSVQDYGGTLIAREVSEPRIVSIRA